MLKLSGVAFLLAVLIDGRDASIYIPVLKSLIDLVIWVSALVLNSIPSCLISDWFFLFRYMQRYFNSFFANMQALLLFKLLWALSLSEESLLDSSFLLLLPDFFLPGSWYRINFLPVFSSYLQRNFLFIIKQFSDLWRAFSFL